MMVKTVLVGATLLVEEKVSLIQMASPSIPRLGIAFVKGIQGDYPFIETRVN